MDTCRVIRAATPSDMAEIMKVVEAAKGIMRQSGNIHQWTDGYPSEAILLSDMDKGGSFVVEENDRVVGYFAFLSSPSTDLLIVASSILTAQPRKETLYLQRKMMSVWLIRKSLPNAQCKYLWK